MARSSYIAVLIATAVSSANHGPAAACERPGASSMNARRSMAAYPPPRLAVGNGYRPGYPPPVYPPPAYPYYPGNYASGYATSPSYGVDPNAGYATANSSSFSVNARAKPTRLLAPSLPANPEPVTLPQGTNRLRYVALSVSSVGSGDTSQRLEEELGKVSGVRGVNVKAGKGPLTMKVWYSDREPVAPRTLIAELERLGFRGTIEGGS